MNYKEVKKKILVIDHKKLFEEMQPIIKQFLFALINDIETFAKVMCFNAYIEFNFQHEFMIKSLVN